MTAHCHQAHRGRIGRRLLALPKWALPAVVLSLMPKCPACVAAYVAMVTGLGVSFAVAARLRTGLIVLSIFWLAYLVFRVVYRLRHRAASGVQAA